jgi:hypothetical protein
LSVLRIVADITLISTLLAHIVRYNDDIVSVDSLDFSRSRSSRKNLSGHNQLPVQGILSRFRATMFVYKGTNQQN